MSTTLAAQAAGQQRCTCPVDTDCHPCPKCGCCDNSWYERCRCTACSCSGDVR